MANYEHDFCMDNLKAFTRYKCEREIRRLESELKHATDQIPIIQALLTEERRKLDALPR